MRAHYQADLVQVTEVLVTMADGVRIAMRRASTALLCADGDLPRRVLTDDADIDALYQQLFAVLLGSTWPHGVGPAIDAAQLGRWYERYADHAVNAGRQVLYLVTGLAAPG